jgi:hypothetical protein
VYHYNHSEAIFRAIIKTMMENIRKGKCVKKNTKETVGRFGF